MSLNIKAGNSRAQKTTTPTPTPNEENVFRHAHQSSKETDGRSILRLIIDEWNAIMRNCVEINEIYICFCFFFGKDEAYTNS